MRRTANKSQRNKSADNKQKGAIVFIILLALLLPLAASAQPKSGGLKIPPKKTTTTKPATPAKSSATKSSGKKSNAAKSTGSTAKSSQHQIPQVIQNLIANMVYVEGGTFTMGANSSEKYHNSNARPAHPVTLSSFGIGKYEVTQAEWQAVMGTNPSHFTGNLQRPVEQVSWDDCQKFIRKLNAMTGKCFRLPTVAEWEYAARGGNKSQGYKYGGSNNIGDVAWYVGNSNRTTHPVGSKSPNELGLYDMSGNVEEWCSDYYGDGKYGLDSYYYTSPVFNPKGPKPGKYPSHIFKGGNFEGFPEYVSANNSNATWNFSSERVGLRLVCGDYSQSTVLRHKEQIQIPQVIQNLITNMIYVEAGSFTMGATSEQGSDAYNDEKPAHKVTLSSFSIGKYEVTQAEWQAVMGYNPSRFKGENLPVENVDWYDCLEFILKLNLMTGEKFRLPTEAEWEYAARGGNRSRGYKYAGSNTLGDVAWYSKNSNRTTHPVGSKSPNELGLYDMSGNVEEWCSDYYDRDYYITSPTNNPKGANTIIQNVSRGGSSWWPAGAHRVSARKGKDNNAEENDYMGFRLAH